MLAHLEIEVSPPVTMSVCYCVFFSCQLCLVCFVHESYTCRPIQIETQIWGRPPDLLKMGCGLPLPGNKGWPSATQETQESRHTFDLLEVDLRQIQDTPEAHLRDL